MFRGLFDETPKKPKLLKDWEFAIANGVKKFHKKFGYPSMRTIAPNNNPIKIGKTVKAEDDRFYTFTSAGMMRNRQAEREFQNKKHGLRIVTP